MNNETTFKMQRTQSRVSFEGVVRYNYKIGMASVNSDLIRLDHNFLLALLSIDDVRRC